MIDLSSFLVLNVDDNGPNRYVKTRLLKSYGLHVVEAMTGREGLRMVRDHRPDLVLLDVRLPDISGIDVCATIKRDADTAGTLVLQTSALATATGDRIHALDAGADSFLVEPAEAEEIIAMVKALLRLRLAERDLEAAKNEADLANAAKSHFMAAASHDLRQPLQAQRLFLTLLEKRLTTCEQRDLAKHVSDSLDATEMLLRSLMDLSALETGRVEVTIRPTDVGAVIARIAEGSSVEATAKGLELLTRLRPLCVDTDEVVFERMVRNLVSNAIRYTERGRILLAVRQCAGEAVVEVWDTGVGIPPGEMDRIFGDYYQVANAERNRAKGLGLGLAVVRRSADLLGHRIAVRSQIGKGSVFRLFLGKPAACPLIGRAALFDQAAAPVEGATVLVVEDDPSLLAGLSLLLESMGCAVIPAADGAEALRLLPSVSPTLMITDLRLPGDLSGLGLVRKVRDRLGHCPAIVQTGDTDREWVSEVGREQGVTLLHKPYNPDRLRSAVVLALASP